MFFALSGFLITGILLDTKSSARPLYNFYGRRFLRIFPPYYIFLALYFVIGPRLGLPIGPPEVDVQSWYWAYLANVRVAIVGWKDAGLLHFWSLAVEEQFYLVWPFVVLHLDRRSLRGACLALLAVAPLLRVGCWLANAPEAAYALTPCRVDVLAAGALVAVLAREGVERTVIVRGARRVLAGSAAVIAAIVIARRAFVDFDPLVYTAGMSATAFAGAALVAIAAYDEDARFSRVMRARWLRAIGVVSYAMYIVHLPVIGMLVLLGVDLRRARPVLGCVAPWLVVGLLGVSALLYAIAFASWHLYEKRLLALKRWFADAPSPAAAPAPVAPPIE